MVCMSKAFSLIKESKEFLPKDFGRSSFSNNHGYRYFSMLADKIDDKAVIKKVGRSWFAHPDMFFAVFVASAKEGNVADGVKDALKELRRPRSKKRKGDSDLFLRTQIVEDLKEELEMKSLLIEQYKSRIKRLRTRIESLMDEKERKTLSEVSGWE